MTLLGRLVYPTPELDIGVWGGVVHGRLVEKLELVAGPVLLDTPRLGTLLRVGVGFEVRTLVVDWVAMELVEFERAGLAGRWVC